MLNPQRNSVQAQRRKRKTYELAIIVRVSQKPGAGPPHVDDNWVDQGRHQDRVRHETSQLRALSHSTGDNRCRRGAERPLEQPDPIARALEPSGQERVSAQELPRGVAKRQTVAQEVPHEEADSDNNQVLQQDGLRVLRANSARLQVCKPKVHEEDQHRAQQHPNIVQRLCVIGHRFLHRLVDQCLNLRRVH